MTAVTERRPAWQRRGTNVAGLPFDDALAKAGIDFEVKACPARAAIPTESSDPAGNYNIVKIPNRQHTYRTDTLQPLGEVGERYHVVNTRECRDLVEEICGGGWTPEFAGPINAGRAVFIVGKLPFQGYPEIDPYLALVNSFDGSTGIRLCCTPIRANCTNAVRRTFAQASSSINLRHTSGLTSRVEMIRSALGLAEVYYRRLDDEIQQLIAQELDDRRLRIALETLYEFKPSGDKDRDEAREARVGAKRNAFLNHLATTPTIPNEHRYTSWGLINATTELEQWFSKSSGTERQAETLLGSHMGIVPTVNKSDRLYKLVGSWS